MILAPPPTEYRQQAEFERNRTIELEDIKNRKIGHDVEITNERLILTSPDGARWSVTVDNAGVIAATAL